jgi:hypothetical protein
MSSISELFCDSPSSSTRSWLADICESKNFEKALIHVPTVFIEEMKQLDSTLSEEDIRKRYVASSWRNRECKVCFWTASKLLICGKCYLVFYCSEECQKADWIRHKKECLRELNQKKRRKRSFKDFSMTISNNGSSVQQNLKRVFSDPRGLFWG